MERALRACLGPNAFKGVLPVISRRMSAIRGRNTGPERIVRCLVSALGYRYRLHVRSLPGTPDLVLRRIHKIIDVRGCFWHAHRCCHGHIPQTRRKFWQMKLGRTVQRDRAAVRKLRREGWQVLVIWECETERPAALLAKVKEFLRF
jgi:DNA mismatch endonuclease, patch repair protein